MGPLIGLVLLFIVLAVLNNDFIDPSNLRNLLRQVSINALIVSRQYSGSDQCGNG